MVWKLRDVDSVPYKFNREPIHGPDDFAQMYAFLFHEEPTEKMVVFVMNTRQLCVAVDTIVKVLSIAHQCIHVKYFVLQSDVVGFDYACT